MNESLLLDLLKLYRKIDFCKLPDSLKDVDTRALKLLAERLHKQRLAQFDSESHILYIEFPPVTGLSDDATFLLNAVREKGRIDLFNWIVMGWSQSRMLQIADEVVATGWARREGDKRRFLVVEFNTEAIATAPIEDQFIQDCKTLKKALMRSGGSINFDNPPHSLRGWTADKFERCAVGLTDSGFKVTLNVGFGWVAIPGSEPKSVQKRQPIQTSRKVRINHASKRIQDYGAESL
ncbi:hypothetical protein ACQ4M3_39455 [Leptolyngbya sp. AN03gr2]|uniref:hypothetical protein n=1 Tax=unclassified Leptolyngbya TaxID=2650499 RepID=UPI003D323BF8